MHVRKGACTLIVVLLSLYGCSKQEPAPSPAEKPPEAANRKSSEANKPPLSSARSPVSSGDHNPKPAEDHNLKPGEDHNPKPAEIQRGPAWARLLNEHSGAITALAFSADGRTLASASADKTARLWNVETAKSRVVFRTQPGEVTGVAFLSDGQTLASSGGEKDVGTVKRWEAASGKEKAVLHTQPEVPQQLAASPDGKLLAWGDRNDILFWDVERGALRTTLKGVVLGVDKLTFSRDGKKLAVIAQGGNVLVWDVDKPTEPLLKLQPGLPDCLAWNRDGTELAIGTGDKSLALWDLASKKPRKTISSFPDNVSAVAYSPDGKVLAAASLDWIFCYDPATGNLLAKAKAPFAERHHPGCLVFSPDGKILASGAAEISSGSIILWDVAALLKP